MPEMVEVTPKRIKMAQKTARTSHVTRELRRRLSPTANRIAHGTNDYDSNGH